MITLGKWRVQTYVHNHPLVLGTSSRLTVTASAAKEKVQDASLLLK